MEPLPSSLVEDPHKVQALIQMQKEISKELKIRVEPLRKMLKDLKDYIDSPKKLPHEEKKLNKNWEQIKQLMNFHQFNEDWIGLTKLDQNDPEFAKIHTLFCAFKIESIQLRALYCKEFLDHN